ncbi:MAG TPA: Gfo/Idh/MocA family oxidoreductase [Chthonomonadaceae bacterium]|nr:Gfo/Idh/MocA family oxidoreductase [Chthonomonadaceae bacterium]
MTKIKAAIIGCGGRGTEHAVGYAASPDVEIVGLVDPLPATLNKLADKYGVKGRYATHQEMFAEQKPDIVSVCTWTGLHPEHVLDSAAAGVRAIHSEKPIAPTWGEAKKMHAACVKAGVQLTFCHQRRFGAHFIKAKQLANEGAIGKITRLEGYCSNLFDWGTHWFDMLFFYHNETPAEWVMGQIDTAKAHPVYGVPVESTGLSHIRYTDGVNGLLFTGNNVGENCSNRIIGEKGIIETEVHKGPRVRILREGGSGWQAPDLTGIVPPKGDTVLSILDAIDCMQTGRVPTLNSHNAMRATELIFATYESSRQRAMVKLPLEIEDSPLLSMLGVTEVAMK